MLTEIIKFFTLFGGCLSLAMASAHLVERKRTDAHFLIFGFLCSLGIWQIYHGFMISGFLFSHPHLALVHVPFLYVSAPFLYFLLPDTYKGQFHVPEIISLPLHTCYSYINSPRPVLHEKRRREDGTSSEFRGAEG